MIRNTNATVWNLEHHMAQMSKLIEERLLGSLPRNTEINPKESLKGVSLRSGKQLSNFIEKEAEREVVEPSNIVDLEAPIEVKEKIVEQGKEKSDPLVYQPKLPYTVKVKKDQQDEQCKKFLYMFKTLHINVPFVEALAQMLRYAKFLKKLLTNKRKLEDVSLVILSEECSALITNSLPNKEKDPRGFIIPCTIEGLIDEKELADLGASINLTPYKIFQKLGLGEPKSTPMMLQLVDRSIRQPRGDR
ncbi:uncharacterized protein LOC120263114 [Dioscorea cayenensis subsp. rotundata]|uniref:Uncharacterized protein LOC120263114 n=1 Tax=Dioscorea cayennensis subsp. rotundata TaxID=55577 RepID=A0AB40BHW8_DIOCR|nr:uncharacterized protein LOC120263114 [Dioscorea cayenensis subsp. rotundata]